MDTYTMSSMETLTLVTGRKLLTLVFVIHSVTLYRVSFLMHLLGESLNNEFFYFSKCFAFPEMLVRGIT